MVSFFSLLVLTNIDWCRNRIEQLMSDSLHRRVHLGHLGLTLGLDGVAIATSEIQLADRSGHPLIRAGRSEIGIALRPLLSGQLKIRHLSFQQPELWAIKLDKNSWNFSDLLNTALDVNYIESSEGTVHVKDDSQLKSGRIATTELRNVELKFARLSKHFRKPFLLSFTQIKPNRTSQLELYGQVSGRTPNWQENSCQLTITATNVNQDDIRTLQSISDIDLSRLLSFFHDHAISGLFSMSGKMNGTFNRDFSASLKLQAHGFACSIGQIAKFRSALVSVDCDLKADRDNLTWQNSNIVVPNAGAHIRSEGLLHHWRNPKESEVNGTAVAVLSNLSDLTKELFLPPLNSSGVKCPLQGEALIDYHFNGRPKQMRYSAYAKLAGVTFKSLLDYIPMSLRSYISILNLDDHSTLSGEINLANDGDIKLNDGLLEAGGNRYKLSGLFANEKQLIKCDFSSKNLALGVICNGLKRHDAIADQLSKMIWLAPVESLNFDGKADLSGIFEKVGNETKITGDISLNGVRLTIAAPRACFQNVRGNLSIHPTEIALNDVAATCDNGTIVLSGSLPRAPSGKLAIQIRASHFNLENLNSLLYLIKSDIPLLEEHELTGTVRDLQISITGTRSRPIISLTGTPESLYYRAPGVNPPLHAVSGLITYANDQLDLHETLFVCQSGEVLGNLSIKQLSTKPVLAKLRLKTAGLSIKETESLLCSALAPPELRQAYETIKHQQNIAIYQGQVQGDLSYKPAANSGELNGKISLNNFSGKYGILTIERGGGTFIFTDSSIKAQNVNGSLRKSSFYLDAVLPKQPKPESNWQIDVKAQLDPADWNAVESIIVANNGFVPPDFQAKSPINLRAKSESVNGIATTNFSLASGPNGGLSLKLPFGVFHQPPATPLLYESTLKTTASAFTIVDSRLTLNQDVLYCKGEFTKDKRLTYELSVKSSAFVPIKTVRQLLDLPLLHTEINGSAKGMMTFKRTPFGQRLEGAVSFEKVSLPKFGIANLVGEFVASGPKLKSSQEQTAKLKIERAEVGKLKLSDFSTNVEWSYAESGKQNFRINLPEFQGVIAKGHLLGHGDFEPDRHGFNLHAYLSKASASALVEELFEMDGELNGTLDSEVDLTSNGKDASEIAANIVGQGDVSVRNGSVTRFGQLQAKLNQVNLVHQGLFGFNLNNLLQSVVPVRTGNFKILSTSWRVKNGKLTIDRLRYNADDMHLWAAGQANLPLKTLEMSVAGQIPRVSSSLIGGTVGGLSKQITVQKVMGSLTRHKLEDLPSFPVLGDIASSKPRVFSFYVLSSLDEPKTLSQSIEKSFHWLPNKPNATAHPVFGPAYN